MTQDTVEPNLTATPKSTLTLASTLTPTPLPTEITDAKDVEMALVPAGEFIMGSDDGKDDEKPAHTVYLDAYYIDKYEVTNAAYKVCVDAGVCQPPKLTIHSGASDNSVYYGNSKFDNYPVIFMDWFSANAYCEWREASLPTEAQWEKAARGTDERLYPWGDEISCDKANYSVTYRYGCSRDTSEVGSYPRGVSPYGVYDLVGNVSEWVADWYSATYYQISPQSNPQGPDSGQYRVLRGGWWFDYYHEHFISTSRNKAEPNYSGEYFSRIVGSGYEAIGFRCAKDATP